MKTCKRCHQPKELSEFYGAGTKTSGRSSLCKLCKKEYDREYRELNKERIARRLRDAHLKRKYGISATEFDSLLQKQGGVCAVCEAEAPDDAQLHVDHDHGTGEVRGILCVSCNIGVGMFKDNPELLQKAAAYLK